MLEIFSLFADYNAEMNLRNYQACQKLSNAELLQERGAFFGSILGTLNHLIVADTLWLQRMANHPAQFSCLRELAAEPKPTSLDLVLYTDLDSWYARRTVLDRIIKQLIAELNVSELDSVLFYTRTEGDQANRRMRNVLQHFFNHQTHHRGQVSTLLFQAGVDVGVTDIMAMVPNAVKN